MGFKHRHYLSGNKVYSCSVCRCNLATIESMISRRFNGQHGQAYLFDAVFNIVEGEAEDRPMTTGLHRVRDITCGKCGQTMGWKYDRAYEQSQKYKEGKSILEKALLIESSPPTFSPSTSTSSPSPPITSATPPVSIGNFRSTFGGGGAPGLSSMSGSSGSGSSGGGGGGAGSAASFYMSGGLEAPRAQLLDVSALNTPAAGGGGGISGSLYSQLYLGQGEGGSQGSAAGRTERMRSASQESEEM